MSSNKNEASMKSSNDNTFGGLTVLIVDEIDNMRFTVAKMLGTMNFANVLQAANGSDAMSILRKQKVDLVITEMQLPKINGLELLKAIRNDEKLESTLVIMMSAVIEQHEVLLAIQSGVSEYVVKPFSRKILQDRINRAINNPIKKSSLRSSPKNKIVGDINKAGSISILVVDDNADNILIIREILNKEYKVKVTTSGKKALELCNSETQPDLVLLDIMMPEMDGLEVCQKLKSDPHTQHIAIIFLTALDQNRDVIKGLELGAVDYITKPVNPLVVKARVKAHIQTIQTNRVMRNQIDTLLENERLKEEFDRVLQHDIKQPLNEIIKISHSLDRYHKDGKRVKESASTIVNTSSALAKMIDNMMTISQLEDGRYKLSPIKLSILDTINNVVNMHRFSIREKFLAIQIEVPNDVYVNAEEILTVTLLSNLFQNAIEAAPNGSAIKFRLNFDNKMVVLELQNQGSIPEDITEKFFDKYISYGKKSGYGIGTYAAKMMVLAQHGSIHFESSIDNGTTLFISLPKWTY